MHIAVLLKVLKVDDNDASPFSTQQQEAFSRHFTRALEYQGGSWVGF